MTSVQKRRVALILVCHFTASFAALGMPPFFGLILTQSLNVNETYLIGWFYIVPTICAAMTSPWWGRMADRWGKKISLLRAQLGLSLGFLLAGLATDQWWFFAALVVQGTLGGTFAASNAYLTQVVQGEELARCLNLMQGSARAAMVAAPVLFGLLVDQASPISLYLYLALLPLFAACMLVLAPRITPSVVKASQKTSSCLSNGPVLSKTALYILQFGFAFGSVVSFPYFVPYAQFLLPETTTLLAGILFSLPHLVYLLAVRPIERWSDASNPVRGLWIGLLLLSISYWWQCLTSSFVAIMLARLIMGAAMTLCFVELHRLMSLALSRSSNGHLSGGRLFGNLDSASKWAGVCSGLAAGVVAEFFGLAAPLWVGMITAGGLSVYLIIVGNITEKETSDGAIKLR